MAIRGWSSDKFDKSYFGRVIGMKELNFHIMHVRVLKTVPGAYPSTKKKKDELKLMVSYC